MKFTSGVHKFRVPGRSGELSAYGVALRVCLHIHSKELVSRRLKL